MKTQKMTVEQFNKEYNFNLNRYMTFGEIDKILDDADFRPYKFIELIDLDKSRNERFNVSNIIIC